MQYVAYLEMFFGYSVLDFIEQSFNDTILNSFFTLNI